MPPTHRGAHHRGRWGWGSCTQPRSMEEEEEAAGFGELPADALEEILVRIPASARRRLRLVCRHWRDVVDDRTPERRSRAKTLVYVSRPAGAAAYVLDDDDDLVEGRRCRELWSSSSAAAAAANRPGPPLQVQDGRHTQWPALPVRRARRRHRRAQPGHRRDAAAHPRACRQQAGPRGAQLRVPGEDGAVQDRAPPPPPYLPSRARRCSPSGRAPLHGGTCRPPPERAVASTQASPTSAAPRTDLQGHEHAHVVRPYGRAIRTRHATTVAGAGLARRQLPEGGERRRRDGGDRRVRLRLVWA